MRKVIYLALAALSFANKASANTPPKPKEPMATYKSIYIKNSTQYSYKYTVYQSNNSKPITKIIHRQRTPYRIYGFISQVKICSDVEPSECPTNCDILSPQAGTTYDITSDADARARFKCQVSTTAPADPSSAKNIYLESPPSNKNVKKAK